MASQWRGVIEEYRDRLPVGPRTPVVTLGEGGTPLVRARVLSERTRCQVWIKFEGANPTGSFKDRGMTMAISKAAQAGVKAVICASTGNTSASAAAYATAAGMACGVLVPDGKIAMGKLSQAIAHGATLLQVDGVSPGPRAALVIVTHRAPDAALSATVDALARLPIVASVDSVMRVESES